MSTFGQVVRMAFWGCLEFNLLLLYLIFVFFPLVTIMAIRRIHIKNKMKRKMIRNGIPRKQAKIYSKRYQSFLANYSSLRGIFRITRKTRKLVKEKKKETNNKPELENMNSVGSYSIV